MNSIDAYTRHLDGREDGGRPADRDLVGPAPVPQPRRVVRRAEAVQPARRPPAGHGDGAHDIGDVNGT